MTIFKKNWASKGQKEQRRNVKKAQPEVADSVRIISVRAFFERLPKAAAKAIKKSNDEDVQYVNSGLAYVAYIDLDSPVTTRDLTTLMDASILTQDEVDNLILVDGESYELYKGVL